MDDQKKLQYVLLPGQNPSTDATGYYASAFQCWDDVWTETFKLLDSNKKLFSDNFTRQDLITAIFVDDRCAAMTLMRFPDLNIATMTKDSYFSNWRCEDIEKLHSRGKRTVICSHFTIHKDFRRQATGVNFKRLLAGIASYTFFNLEFDVMTGAMRRDRSVHSSSYEWGALPISECRPSGHGDEVDLVAVYQDHLANFSYPPDLFHLVAMLWEQRLSFVDLPLRNNLYFAQGEHDSTNREAA